MARPRTHGRQLAEVLPIAADDELPALEVLRASGPTARVQDPDEVLRVEWAIGELADHPLRRHRFPDGHHALVGHDPISVRVAVVAAGSAAAPGIGAAPSDRGRGRGAAIGASERKPRGSFSTTVGGRTVSGSRRASVAAARSPASSRVRGPPSARARNDATTRRYSGNSYSQE